MTIARYSITSGLSGCYMPNSVSGPYAFGSRKELADAIRYEIEFMGWPTSLFRQVRIANLWDFIKRNGSSSAHFSIYYGAEEIAFHGLTEEEFEAGQEDDE